MYMIEITEDRLHTMAEHAEKGLRHLGKLMQCLDDLEGSSSNSGAYGDRGSLRREEEDDSWEDRDSHRRYSKSKKY